MLLFTIISTYHYQPAIKANNCNQKNPADGFSFQLRLGQVLIWFSIAGWFLHSIAIKVMKIGISRCVQVVGDQLILSMPCQLGLGCSSPILIHSALKLTVSCGERPNFPHFSHGFPMANDGSTEGSHLAVPREVPNGAPGCEKAHAPGVRYWLVG